MTPAILRRLEHNGEKKAERESERRGTMMIVGGGDSDERSHRRTFTP